MHRLWMGWTHRAGTRTHFARHRVGIAACTVASATATVHCAGDDDTGLSPFAVAGGGLVAASLLGGAYVYWANGSNTSTDMLDPKDMEQTLASMRRHPQAPADLVKAREWADQGHAEAQYVMAVVLSEGKALPMDLARARELFQMAADQGHAPAQYMMATKLRDGVPADVERARELMQLAVDQEYAPAQYSMAVMLCKGDGVPLNEVKAHQMLQLAADQGHGDAQHLLAIMLSNGIGGPANMERAREMLQLAADQGHRDAQRKLGWMLHEGKGGPVDLERARELYQLAADQGDESAQKYMASMGQVCESEE